jgi:hypothetical protein
VASYELLIKERAARKLDQRSPTRRIAPRQSPERNSTGERCCFREPKFDQISGGAALRRG